MSILSNLAYFAHHIFSQDLYKETSNNRQFLIDMGFGVNDAGNRIGLFGDNIAGTGASDTATFLFSNGFLGNLLGVASHDGNHPGYRNFLTEQINDIRAQYNATKGANEAAARLEAVQSLTKSSAIFNEAPQIWLRNRKNWYNRSRGRYHRIPS